VLSNAALGSKLFSPLMNKSLGPCYHKESIASFPILL
jgi:hypothetical protein